MAILIGLILSSLVAYLLYYVDFPFLTSKRIKWITTFSGAYLLGITFFHILPEIFGGHGHASHQHHVESDVTMMGVWVFAGFFIQLLLDFFSKGIEHGHAHKNIGWTVVIALSVHSFIEAIPIFTDSDHQHNQLMLGILLHKIPVAIVLANILKEDTVSKKKAFTLISLFVLSAPLGILAGANFGFLQEYHKEILALVVGLLLHISTTILFESTSDHHIKIQKLIAILAGFFLSFLLIFSH
ncbi:MAG: ZIP family metal transporter [Flavobacteriales bacterium]